MWLALLVVNNVSKVSQTLPNSIKMENYILYKKQKYKNSSNRFCVIGKSWKKKQQKLNYNLYSFKKIRFQNINT